MAKVYFIDVTNRDGVQASRIKLSKFQKTMLNWHLAKLGIHQSEAGFPFLDHEQNYLRVNLELRGMGAFGDMVVSGWCRALREDVMAAVPVGLKDFNLSISTSDQMIRHKFQGRLNKAAVIREAVGSVVAAREIGARTIGINAEDASRTDLGYLVEFALAAKEAGAQRLRYCDTVGQDTPHSIERRVAYLAEKLGITLELHCHNDLGLAVANSVAGARGAVLAGVDAWINTSVNGIGERAGNADLLGCILALSYGAGLEGVAIGDPINLKAAWELGNYASYAFKIPIPINQPGVGANAFAHESGIHADGALKDHHNYELYDYAALGRVDEVCEVTGRTITAGEYGGLAGLKYVYERLGIPLDDGPRARYLLSLAQYVNAQNQLPLRDDELRFIAQYPDQVRQLMAVAGPSRPEAPIYEPKRPASRTGA